MKKPYTNTLLGLIFLRVMEAQEQIEDAMT
jgi:hypothetical protein